MGGTPGEAAPLYAILVVALPQALFVVCLWLLHGGLTRSAYRRLPVTLMCLACIGAVPLAVMAGLSLPWALLLLSVGPVLTIVHNARLAAGPADTLQPAGFQQRPGETS